MIQIALPTLVFTGIIASLSALVLLLRNSLLPQKPVSIFVENEKTLDSITGDKLLPALQRAGFAVPSVCAGAGTCGLCKVQVLNGVSKPLPTEVALLSPAEIKDGVRLSCQLTLSNDLSIKLPDSLSSAGRWTCSVMSNRNLSPLIKELVLQLPKDNTFSFTAGEYVQVTAPPYQRALSNITIDPPFETDWQALSVEHLIAATDDPVSRAYSVANLPSDKDKIVLLIRLALPPPDHLGDWPPGIVSSWLFSLTAGDKVEISGPFGDFKARDSEKDIVLIGGGVGMAPLRAIAHDQLSRGSTAKIQFYYGARSLKDLFYQEEFDQLASDYNNFDWTVALSEPEAVDQWNGDIGFIHQTVQREHIQKHPTPERCEYYLCGPPLMLQATTSMLQKAGISDENIFADSFGSGL